MTELIKQAVGCHYESARLG